MKCNCSDWKECTEQLNDQAVFCSTQIAGPDYTGKKFVFCPWCGKLLAASANREWDSVETSAHNAISTDGSGQ